MFHPSVTVNLKMLFDDNQAFAILGWEEGKSGQKQPGYQYLATEADRQNPLQLVSLQVYSVLF